MAIIHEKWVVELFDGWDARQQGRMYALLASLKPHLSTVSGRLAKRGKADSTKENAA
jgi:hypothetical protein